jgi:hypothetical protein
MDFYLKYDGPLKSNGSAQDKQDIREYLYPQLKRLWDIEPLRYPSSRLLGTFDSVSVLRKIDDITFAPLVSSKLKFICQLDITMLWPEEQGVISNVGGDIDNRLKTLFDALQCPDINQIQPVKEKYADKQPFFCLLENDKLITSVDIKTHTLLCAENKKDVSVLIHVIIKSTMPTWDTFGLSR